MTFRRRTRCATDRAEREASRYRTELRTERAEAGTTSGEGTFHGGKMLVSSREGGRYEGTIKVPAGGYASSSSSGDRLDLGVGEWLLPPLDRQPREVGAADGPCVDLALEPVAEAGMTFELVNRAGLGSADERRAA